MGLGTGVELEWSIIFHALREGGILPSEFKKRNTKAGGKIQPYSKPIQKQALSAVEHAYKIVGIDGLKNAWHSDEWNIKGNPEPKTDIIFKKGGTPHRVSVKMRGPIQLQSGEGKSTARVFGLVGEKVYSGRMGRNLKQIIDDLEKLPTRMGSQTNIERLKANPKLAEEFLEDGDIKKNLLYQSWVENKKPELMEALVSFLEKDQKFKQALIKETMTGELTFGSNKLAIANYILTPDYYKKIDNTYVRSKMPDVKIDVRAKSRSGVTSLATRIELKK